MAARYGSDIGGSPGEPHLIFPTAAELAGADDALLTGPRAKAETLRTLVKDLADGSLEIGVGDDRREQSERLTAYRGLGPWTAGYIAMRVLGAPDVLLDGDVALRTGAKRLGFADDRATLTARAARLAPWRSYLCLHLWAASAEPRPIPAEQTPDLPRSTS
jgi:AraC family transcriptional regulator of adaptative response / DNA-3-methyladenine glycosylase II